MNGTKFYDIYDYIYVPYWKTAQFAVILAIVFALACTILLTYLIIRKRRNMVVTPAITPGEWALGELRKLTPQTYETKEEFKQFYFELARIIKEYLEKQFSFDVIEKTDSELVEYLREQQFAPDRLEIIEKILQGSLHIKFANAQALRDQAEQDLDLTKRIFLRY